MKREYLMGHLGSAFLSWRRWLQREYEPWGLTLKQLYALRALERQDGLHPSDVAELLFCDRPTVTVIIRNLEKAGWTNRSPDPASHKHVRIGLTDRGRGKLDEIRAANTAPGSGFDPTACFTDEEFRHFSELALRLEHHLRTLPTQPAGKNAKRGAPTIQGDTDDDDRSNEP